MGRHLPIVAVLAVQVGVLGFIVGRQLYARAAGVPVTLRTAPIDPYDVMSGYYLDLAYEVERDAREQVPPGLERGECIWLNLRKAPEAWELVSVTREPDAAADDHVSLPAVRKRFGVRLHGAGRLYLPETQRRRAGDRVREGPDRGLVDLRVLGGTIAVVRLRLGDETFGE
ncbi:MAG: GDYXXLXY domain-containing protein [Planctomycetota bacterium]